jgi:hypothetical protein
MKERTELKIFRIEERIDFLLYKLEQIRASMDYELFIRHFIPRKCYEELDRLCLDLESYRSCGKLYHKISINKDEKYEDAIYINEIGVKTIID